MKTSNVISRESQEHFWYVVKKCLYQFHQATPTVYERFEELQAKINDSPIGEIELFFHGEPFDVACDIARNGISVESVLEQYLAIRDSEDDPPLIKLIRYKALTYGKFMLASGQRSDYYIDLSKVLFDGDGLVDVADAINFSIGGSAWLNIDSVGGPAMGAIPIVSSVITLSSQSFLKQRGFFVRKESKSYGKGDLIEGNLQFGDRVLMIEDVTTTGGSLLKAIEEVQAKGCTIVEVISVLDREQGAVELFRSKSIPFTSLVKISEVL